VGYHGERAETEGFTGDAATEVVAEVIFQEEGKGAGGSWWESGPFAGFEWGFWLCLKFNSFWCVLNGFSFGGQISFDA